MRGFVVMTQYLRRVSHSSEPPRSSRSAMHGSGESEVGRANGAIIEPEDEPPACAAPSPLGLPDVGVRLRRHVVLQPLRLRSPSPRSGPSARLRGRGWPPTSASPRRGCPGHGPRRARPDRDGLSRPDLVQHAPTVDRWEEPGEGPDVVEVDQRHRRIMVGLLVEELGVDVNRIEERMSDIEPVVTRISSSTCGLPSNT